MKKLPYQPHPNIQPVNMSALRPGKAYDVLVKNRDAVQHNQSWIDESGNIKQECLHYRACPNCGMKKDHRLFNKEKFDVVECQSCGLVYVNPVLKSDSYQDIYADKSYQDITKVYGETSHEYRRERFGTERMDFIEKFTPSTLPKTLLEIGCSTGFLIEEAVSRQWDSLGIDLNPSAVKFGQERGLPLTIADLMTAELPHQQYSAITLFDVLEHLINPKEILEKVYSLLAPGGCVYIYVPNYQSASRHLLGVEHSQFICTTHHLTYFTPDTLQNFVESCDMKVLHWETQGLDIEDWCWRQAHEGQPLSMTEDQKSFLQFAINASGYGKNLRMFAQKI